MSYLADMFAVGECPIMNSTASRSKPMCIAVDLKHLRNECVVKFVGGDFTIPSDANRDAAFRINWLR